MHLVTLAASCSDDFVSTAVGSDTSFSENFPLHAHHPDDSVAASLAAERTFAVLGHSSGDGHSVLDAAFASNSIIPAYIALAYFNMTSSPFHHLFWHPSNIPNTSAPLPPSVHSPTAASSPWLTPLTPLPPLSTPDLPPITCFSHVLVGHESAFRLSSESDAVRGVALRGLRHAVLRHHNAHITPTSSLLQINFYSHSTTDEAAEPGTDRIGCSSFFQLLEGAASDAVKDCVDIDRSESFSASARAVFSAHLHVVPSDMPSAVMLLLARESAVVFVMHARDSNPALVAGPMQLLGDLPWLHVTHVWESDELLRAKLHEAVEHAATRAQHSSASAQGEVRS